MITDKIIEYAREFHELGGTEGINWQNVEWAWNPYLKELQRVDDLYRRSTITTAAIPILTESKLWAWLEKNTCRIYAKSAAKEKTIEILTFGGELYFKPFNNLHEALYSACVWVAQQEKANAKNSM